MRLPSSKRGTYALGKKGAAGRIKAINRNLVFNVKALKSAGYVAITKGATDILKESRKNTPIDTGDLINSSTIVPDVRASGEVRVGVAYLSQHAAAVHETHPNISSSMTIAGEGKNHWPRGRHYLARAMEAKRKTMRGEILASMNMRNGKLPKTSRKITVTVSEDA